MAIFSWGHDNAYSHRKWYEHILNGLGVKYKIQYIQGQDFRFSLSPFGALPNSAETTMLCETQRLLPTTF